MADQPERGKTEKHRSEGMDGKSLERRGMKPKDTSDYTRWNRTVCEKTMKVC